MRAVIIWGLFAASTVAGRMMYNVVPYEFDCTDKDVGLYTLKNCTDIFYHCDGTNTIAVAQQCPDQLVVNIDTGMCDWAYNVAVCNGGAAPTTTTSTMTTTTTTTVATTDAPDRTFWTVIQRRKDHDINFDRNWNEYVAGFGDISGDFWFGLEEIHQLTKNGDQELRIDMITTMGVYLFAQYSSFQISSSADNYRVSLSGYSGNATDAFNTPNYGPDFGGRMNHHQFSTPDVDNDQVDHMNCAAIYGSWWLNACLNANLNGRVGEFYSFAWRNQDTGSLMDMKFSEMKIRHRQ